MAYIDRDKVLKAVEKMDRLDKETKTKYEYDKEGFLLLIKSAPTEDVVEVKHSQWVVEAYDNQDNIVVIPYIEHQHCEPFCLICGKRALLNGAEDYVTSNYCPNCGAKMDGKEVD